MKISHMTDEEVILATAYKPWAIRPDDKEAENTEKWPLSEEKIAVIVLTDIRRLLRTIRNVGIFFVVVFVVCAVIGLLVAIAH
jgi:hypothetical protein